MTSLKKHIPLGAAAVLSVAAIAGYGYYHPHWFDPLRDVSPGILAGLVATRVLFHVTNGLTLRGVAAKFGTVLTAREWFGLPFVTSLGNYITPFSGGMIARASYLKYRHRFPYARFAAVIGASSLILLWVAGMAGILALVLSLERSATFWRVLFFFGAVVLGISTVAILPSARLPGTGRVSAAINRSLDGWDSRKGDPPLLATLALYALANIALQGVSFWLAFVALHGAPVPAGRVFLISLFSSLLMLVRVTPGNLGVFEGVVSLSSGMLGVGAGPGLMASLLVRAASLIPIFTLGPVFSLALTRDLTGRGQRNDDDH
jgi:uncharacterized membrane protein YbhN (UPF0104 family)